MHTELDNLDTPPTPLRTRDATIELILQARTLQSAGAAKTMIRSYGIHEAHLMVDCPILHLAHFELDGFVPEKLHVWYAYYLCVCLLLAASCVQKRCT